MTIEIGGPMGLAEEIARLAELNDSGAMTDEEFARAKARLLEVEEATVPEAPAGRAGRTLRGRLWNGLVLSMIPAAFIALLGYVLLLETSARFVAPVACRGDFSNGYEVERENLNVAGRHISNVFMACISPTGERHEVRGPVIWGTLFIEVTVVLFLLYLVVRRESLFTRERDSVVGPG